MNIPTIIALVINGSILVTLVLCGLLAMYMTYMDIKPKGPESRLVRWPAAIKAFFLSAWRVASRMFRAMMSLTASVWSFVRDFFSTIALLSHPKRARKVLNEINHNQPELPL